MITTSNCLIEVPSSGSAWERETLTAGRISSCGKSKQPGQSFGRKLGSLALIVVLSLIAYFFFSRFVVMTVVVQGRSMAPTLRDGEHLMLNRMAYLMEPPARGDLVVLKDPGYTDYAVKRVVGLPGDALRFDDGEVYLNGRKLREIYLGAGLPTFTPDFKRRCFALAAGEYFVLGDNRGNSVDSRFYGAIRQSDILGLVCH